MAVVFKKREINAVGTATGRVSSIVIHKGNVPKSGEAPLSPRQQAALEAVGLGPVTKAEAVAAMEWITPGLRVKITNTMFFWIKAYKPGDTGKVTRNWPAVVTAFSSSPRDDIYEIELDVERVPGVKKHLLSRWEIEVLQEEEVMA